MRTVRCPGQSPPIPFCVLKNLKVETLADGGDDKMQLAMLCISRYTRFMSSFFKFIVFFILMFIIKVV